MSYLTAIFTTGSLLVVFAGVLLVERKRGVRFFPATRARFDARTARMFYVVEHVDWGAFSSHIFKLSVEKIAHDIVHGTLIFIRFVEKSLTRAIRVLRERLAHRGGGARVEGFQLKETLKQFRKSLHKEENKDTKNSGV